MLFNSFVYIFLFLPITVIVYFVLNKGKLTIISKIWLVLTSLFFYGWWNPKYIPLILASVIFNYIIGFILTKKREERDNFNRRSILILGIIANLLLLGYFKYTDFFISNINHFAKNQVILPYIVLPLGISFFTFTQIAYLVDTYKGSVKEYSFLNYCLFVTFFPHLLAGPIIHHSEMMPQFDNIRYKILNYKNISQGLFLFFMGLLKKVVLADTFAVWANNGFDNAAKLTLTHAWITSFSYTLQIYFDFSGYTDMALGASLMFNIKLPVNFNSPYKAFNIQDFWRRWHITLSRFLRDYIYIPLGGNRVSEPRILFNLIITFFLGGLWHGAGWTFVFWGAMHGFVSVIHRIWNKYGFKFPKIIAWFLTINFINVAWVFFRAKNFKDATDVLKGMVGMNGIVLPRFLKEKLSFLVNYGFEFGGIGFSSRKTPIWILFSFIIVLMAKNSNELKDSFKFNVKYLLLCVFLALISFIYMFYINTEAEFIYFQF